MTNSAEKEFFSKTKQKCLKKSGLHILEVNASVLLLERILLDKGGNQITETLYIEGLLGGENQFFSVLLF